VARLLAARLPRGGGFCSWAAASPGSFACAFTPRIEFDRSLGSSGCQFSLGHGFWNLFCIPIPAAMKTQELVVFATSFGLNRLD